MFFIVDCVSVLILYKTLLDPNLSSIRLTKECVCRLSQSWKFKDIDE